jgi:hypothetical protein
MRYEAFPSIGTKTNRLIVYSPDDTCNDNYDTPFPKLEPVNGAIHPEQFDHNRRTTLPAATIQEFDACSPFFEYRRNSYRGRRRTHAYQLAAKYRNSDVHIFEKWFTSDDQVKLSKLLDLLSAYVQGLRVSYIGTDEIFYQVNKKLDERITSRLMHIRDRTIQLNLERDVDIPGLPQWSTDARIPLYVSTFNRNDWEILAATYRIEVETFLQICLYLGYDYKPVDISEAVEKEDLEGEEEEDDDPAMENSAISSPRPIPDSVRSLIEESLLEKDKGKSVHFSPIPSDYSSHSLSEFPTSDVGRGPSTPFVPKEPVTILQSPRSSTRNSPLAVSTPTKASPEPVNFNLPVEPSDIQHSHPPIQVDRVSSVNAGTNQLDNPFAPIDPVGKSTTVPSYQIEQIDRVYGAPPATPIYSLKEHTGTERFNEMFRPSIYASQHSYHPSTMSHPGAARADFGQSTSVGSGYYVPHSNPMSTQTVSGGTYSYAPTTSQPINLSYGSAVKGSSVPGNNGPPIPPNENFGGKPLGRPPSGPPGNGGFPSGPPSGPPGNGGFPSGPPGPPYHGGGGGFPSGPPGGDPPEPSSGGTVDPLGNNPRNNARVLSGFNRYVNVRETHFDTKLKPDIVPTWNGEESSLGRWILQINELALRSESIFRGLGDVVPTRFRDKAAAWWYSLPDTHRIMVSQNWDTLKDEIRTYWMNQAWIDRTQRRAIRAAYRDAGHPQETPTEYFIRKYELLSLVYNFTPSQVMAEILLKAPRLWSTVLNPRSFNNLAQFQTAIKYHEDLLIDFGNKFEGKGNASTRQPRSFKVDAYSKKNFSKDKKSRPKLSKTYSVGSNIRSSPPHPKDDSVVSKGKTPADYGARGCIFCGSTKHWDRECKHNKGKALHKARNMFVDYEPDDIHAEAEYERCYNESLDSSDDEEDDPENSEQAANENEDSAELTEPPDDSAESEEQDF